ncbi:MAG: hypothetical protein IH999_04250 [Proteobacteria bacterium]|nr:hypothetical protein [Pseudomonadota bacterium]
MQDRPKGAELLAIARRTLVEKLTDLLPEERRGDASRIAEAMAIAAREIEAGERPLRAELERLAALYGETPAEAGDREALEGEVTRLNRRLAADIRAGKFDSPDRRRAARAHLLASARDKLAESKPEHLKARGLD